MGAYVVTLKCVPKVDIVVVVLASLWRSGSLLNSESSQGNVYPVYAEVPLRLKKNSTRLIVVLLQVQTRALE